MTDVGRQGVYAGSLARWGNWWGIRVTAKDGKRSLIRQRMSNGYHLTHDF